MNRNFIESNSTIWDSFEDILIPYPNICYGIGKNADSYIVPNNYNGEVLSKNCLNCGIEKDGFLFFEEESGSKIIDYEFLLYRLKLSYNPLEQEYLKNEIAISQQYGRIDAPDYFGEYPPPNETPKGIVENFIKIRNGFYFVKANNQWNFAVCNVIGDSELTITAQDFGRKAKDYLFYDMTTCAIPFYELRYYTEVDSFICNNDALLNIIHINFQIYVIGCNDSVVKSDHFPTCNINEKDLVFLTTKQLI